MGSTSQYVNDKIPQIDIPEIMKRIDDHFTRRMFTDVDLMGPKRQKYLETSWAYFFRNFLLTNIPVQEVLRRFSDTMGRPAKEVYAMVSAQIIQQIFDYTTLQTLEAFQFNQLWHYALDIHDHSDASMYLCERTLQGYRKRLLEIDAAGDIFRALTESLLKEFHVPTELQRLDSTHLFSNMKHLGRLDLFVETIRDFLQELRRTHQALFKEAIPEELAKRYLEAKNGCFSQITGEEAKKKVVEVAKDLLQLVRIGESIEEIHPLQSFDLLKRVLEEQCRIQKKEAEEKVILKDSKEIKSTSLQNPSDPDATYDGHKGEGYQAQIMETCQQGEAVAPNMIIYLKVEPADKPDAGAVLPAMEETQDRGIGLKTILADTAYGSDDNVMKAKEKGVDLIAPVPGKSKKAEEMLVLRDFDMDLETHEITECQAGEKPIENRITGKGIHIATFDSDKCSNCELRELCKVGLDPKHEIKYSDKDIRLETRRQHEKSKEFKDVYRLRSGIEATNSNLKRNMNHGCLRVRGLAAVRFVVTLKVVGMNIMRAWQWAKKHGMMEKAAVLVLWIAITTLISIRKKLISWIFYNGSPTGTLKYLRKKFDPQFSNRLFAGVSFIMKKYK